MTRPVLRLLVVLAAVCGAALGTLATLVLTGPADLVMTEAAPAHAGGPDHPAPVEGPSGPGFQPGSPASPSPDVRPGSVASPGPDVAPTVPAASGPTPMPDLSARPSPDVPRMLLVWTAGGLPAAVRDVAAADPAIQRFSAVAGDQAGLVGVHTDDGAEMLVLDDGWQIPLDVLAVDPVTHASFVADLSGPADGAAVAGLGPGEALLSEASAALRGVGEGATLDMADGGPLRVAGVIDDRAASGAELVVHTADAARLGVDRPRFLLVSHTGSRSAVQQRLVTAVGSTPVRFRTPAETTWLRHGDAVLPQAMLKEAFGEFAIRLVAGRDVTVDPGWEQANIITREVPILGEVRCHRRLLPRLVGAMEELARRNLAHLVDVDAFAGCYVPRRIAAGEPLSRHAWGVAVDLNVGDNPRGSFSTQDPRLVEAMRAHGFTWGG
ncbi:MAG TPA: M15 family metallopeptidase, partial [Euzebya sp.]|nr:M15 family metallopeptidase [Euzebya sp.]